MLSIKKITPTAQQLQAIECKMGPVLVVAGAGSGKTSVIARRYIYLNQNKKIEADRILCLSFTNAAVRNLESRIARYSTSDHKGVLNVMTFHRLCLKIIQDAERTKNIKIGKPTSNFSLIVKKILEDYKNIKGSGWVTKILIKLRWLCKSENRNFTVQDLEDFAVHVVPNLKRASVSNRFPFDDMVNIYKQFDLELKERRLITLDDIILDAQKLLEDEEILDRWRNKFDAILCDEFRI